MLVVWPLTEHHKAVHHKAAIFAPKYLNGLTYKMSPKSGINDSQRNDIWRSCGYFRLCCDLATAMTLIFNFALQFLIQSDNPLLPHSPSSTELTHRVALKQPTVLRFIKKGQDIFIALCASSLAHNISAEVGAMMKVYLHCCTFLEKLPISAVWRESSQ